MYCKLSFFTVRMKNKNTYVCICCKKKLKTKQIKWLLKKWGKNKRRETALAGVAQLAEHQEAGGSIPG